MTAKMTTSMKRWGRGSLAAFACAILAGCGGGAEAPAPGPAPAKSPGAAVGTVATNGAGAGLSIRSEEFLSVFSTNNPRDPFNPRKKIETASTTAATPESAAEELIKALDAGFENTYGTADNRMAMVHGVLLIRNVEKTIPVPVGGGVRQVKIKPLSILRNAIEAQVEGIPRTVTITKRQR